jgi:hypothetical protein
MEIFSVEYSDAAEHWLMSLVESLWQSKMGLPDGNIYAQELRAVRDSSDAIDRELVARPLTLGHSCVAAHELPQGYPTPDETRAFTLGALSVVYDVFLEQHLVYVIHLTYYLDRN